MKTKLTKASSLTAAIITFGSLVTGANGALLISFEEVDADTKITVSGTLDLSDMTPLALNVNRTDFFQARTDPGRITGHLQGMESQWFSSTGGVETIFPTALGTHHTNSYQGDIFTISTSETSPNVYGAVLHLSGDLTASSTSVTVNGEWTFVNQNIEDNWGNIPTTPITIFNTGGSSNDVVQIVRVPEPSTSLLLGLSSLAILRRSRKQMSNKSQ